MDNIDCFQSVAPEGAEEEGVTPRGRVQLLQRQICTRFQPYREYFLTQPIARVLPAKPSFTPTISTSLRNHLQPQRQVKYLRGVLAQDYCQETLEQLLEEQQYHPIRKLRNTSVVLGEEVVWAEGTKLRTVKIADFLRREKVQGKDMWHTGVASPKTLIDLHEEIYEIAAVSSQIIVRTPRTLFILSKSCQIQRKVTLEQQIIDWHYRSSPPQGKLLLSTYEDRFSQLHEQGGEKGRQVWCRVDGLVHSLWSKTDSEIVLCKENAILVADRRKRVVHELMRRAKAHQNRIYSGISLADTNLGCRYFATCQSFNICLYDMRKPHEPTLKIPHYCEEAPPSILQTWSSTSNPQKDPFDIDDLDSFITSSEQWREENPLLIAHSPYLTGSSLFTELSLNWESPLELVRMQAKGEFNPMANRLRLLYDAGKMQEHYHPRGVSPFSPAPGQVGFLHFDNFHGISLEILERVSANHDLKGYKSSPNSFTFQRVNISASEHIQEMQPANQEWFQRRTLEKHLQPLEEEGTDALSDEEGLELEDEPFEQRVVRFADMRAFYHRIHTQAQENPLPERIRKEEVAIRKEVPLSFEFRGQPTQSQSQREESSIRAGMRMGYLTESSIGELLDEWSSL